MGSIAGAMGALVLFDMTHSGSFEAVEKWKKDLDQKCLLPDGRRIPAVLLANKSDLKRDKRLPDDLAISQFVHEAGFVPKWFKTSAKSGDGIKEAVSLLSRYIITMDTWNEPLKDSFHEMELLVRHRKTHNNISLTEQKTSSNQMDIIRNNQSGCNC